MPVYRQLHPPSLRVSRSISINVDGSQWHRPECSKGRRRVRTCIHLVVERVRFRVGMATEGYNIAIKVRGSKRMRKVATKCRRAWKA